ncbi:hypothetical protein ASF66_15890 [Pseudomonas sp. Leaf129]|nr:hypothetical protein ASF66_15890 [Pseudomonas sp. Leaf129]
MRRFDIVALVVDVEAAMPTPFDIVVLEQRRQMTIKNVFVTPLVDLAFVHSMHLPQVGTGVCHLDWIDARIRRLERERIFNGRFKRRRHVG